MLCNLEYLHTIVKCCTNEYLTHATTLTNMAYTLPHICSQQIPYANSHVRIHTCESALGMLCLRLLHTHAMCAITIQLTHSSTPYTTRCMRTLHTHLLHIVSKVCPRQVDCLGYYTRLHETVTWVILRLLSKARSTAGLHYQKFGRRKIRDLSK